MPRGRTRLMTSSRVRSGKRAVKSPSFITPKSDVELLQIVDAHPSAFKRWAIPHVLLDVVMLHALAARRAKNALPIDDAGPDLGKRIAFEAIGSGRISALEILDMQHHESAGVLVQIFNRVLAREGGPEAVHFHLDQILVRRTQKLIVADYAIVDTILEIVIVICELHPRVAAHLSQMIEEAARAVPAIEGFLPFGMRRR